MQTGKMHSAILAGLSLLASLGPTACKPKNTFSVYFSPEGGAQSAVIAELERAQQSVLVEAYYFTSAPIAKAVVEARRRGIDIQVILDRSQRTQKYSSADFFAHEDVPTWIDSQHAIAHNKVMIFDRETIITGSFNFTKSAEQNNAENLLVIRNQPALAREYIDDWNFHRSHSESYQGK
jgi:phosphatidylserine/phosphatidylglycerophosphate/cardiolipin synthase-like enzyme